MLTVLYLVRSEHIDAVIKKHALVEYPIETPGP